MKKIIRQLYHILSQKVSAQVPQLKARFIANTESTCHQPDPEQIPVSQPYLGLTLVDLIHFYQLPSLDLIEKLTIHKEEEVQTLDNQEQIKQYPLVCAGQDSQQNLFLQLTYQAQGLNAPPLCITRNLNPNLKQYTFTIFCLPRHREKTSKKTEKNTSPICFKTDIQCRSFNHIKAEYLYIQNGEDPHTRTLKASLSAYEWDLLSSMTKETAVTYYRGKKDILQGNYLAGIKPLKHIFEQLKNTWYNQGLSVKEMKLLTETAYWIGHACVKLQQFDQAYHYLELASRFNQEGFRYKREFINCLVNSRNLLSILFIDDYLKEYSKDMSKGEIQDFCNFLLRRKAYLLIEMRLLEDAENILLNLLNLDPENRIVLDELAYIQEEKKKQKVK